MPPEPAPPPSAAQPGWPLEPAPSSWQLTLDSAVPGEDLVGVGADLAPGTLLAAYRRGLFPMGVGRGGRGPMGWWSPDPRGVLPLDGLVVSRSLRAAVRRRRVSVDAAFGEVMARCADRRRPGRWITEGIAEAYTELHRLGWAHSVEVWDDEGELVGGLYGVAVAGLFAGESMFHDPRPAGRDASKVALVHLVELLRDGDGDGDAPRRLLDVQWRTDHLATLGVVEIPRAEYLRRLRTALTLPLPPSFATPPPASPSSPTTPVRGGER
ncbi:MAG: leucyl/phenylalanyl-tRNA--protein transferase [Actinomycetales bacterium]